MGCEVMDEGHLPLVPFTVNVESLKFTVREAVFLKPLRP